MPAGIINILVLDSYFPLNDLELTQMLTDLRERAEAKQNDFFIRQGFRDSADFTRQFRHFSGLVVQDDLDGTPVFWQNNSAKHILSKELSNALKKVFL
jgi:hypothetical protein